ncbi:MAG: glycosyltransferase [Phycisphaerales bacterium]
MRIVHLTNSIDPVSGGPANVLARLAPVQVQRGHEVTIITADAPESVRDIVETLRIQGVAVEAKGPGSGPISRAPGAIRSLNLAIERGVDLMHGHGLWQHLVHWGASMSRKRGTPYIIRPCGMLDPWSLSQGRLKKQLFLAMKARKDLNRSAAVHYTTETERKLTEPLNLRAPAFIIPNGLDWGEFENLPPAGAFREKHGLGDRPLVVFLSRLHHKKGLDLLLPAFADAAPQDAVLALVGPSDENYLSSLKAQGEQLGVSDRLIFTGMLKGTERIEALADADLFTLPSYQENFGVAVIEAAGAGTPVLISDQVNICGEVEAAKVGRVVACETGVLGAALGEMLADRVSLRVTGERARAWARDHFSWSSIADQVDAMYASVVSR